jgi:hypothetical protein
MDLLKLLLNLPFSFFSLKYLFLAAWTQAVENKPI